MRSDCPAYLCFYLFNPPLQSNGVTMTMKYEMLTLPTLLAIRLAVQASQGVAVFYTGDLITAHRLFLHGEGESMHIFDRGYGEMLLQSRK